MLDVLIIGCGNVAGGFDADRITIDQPFSHAGAYLAHGGFVLRGCVEPDEVRRNAFQDRWGVERSFSCVEEVLHQDCKFDVISICSPTSFHASHLNMALLLKPKLVFCEKPMTASLEDSLGLEIKYREAGIPLMINYTRRWDACVRSLSAELNGGKWGKVRSASGVYNKGLYNNGSHMLDLLFLLLGPLTVIAAGPSNADMWEDDPSIPAMLLSEKGVTVSLNCGHASDYVLFELELVTEQGVIKMENSGFSWQTRKVGPSTIFSGYRVLNTPLLESGAVAGATLAAVDEITKLVAIGGRPSCAAVDAVYVQTLCDEVRIASSQRA
jgi:predicted dehydrogenase